MVNKVGITSEKRSAIQKGFTLIEVAIVLVIVGLLLGGVLTPLGTQMEENRRKSTLAEMEVLQEALIGFALSQGRLPCPDDDGDGIEDPVGGVGGCDSTADDIPAVTMGISATDA